MDKLGLKAHLHECLRREVMRSNKPFSWFRTFHRAIKCPNRRYFFWWRIASYLHDSGKPFSQVVAAYINRKLIFKYGTEIELGAIIGVGLKIAHHNGVTVSHIVNAGQNLILRQNTTVGAKLDHVKNKRVIIGDNVDIGANSCIIGSDLKIGNNVIIGAMSFINRDIPDNCTVYTEKTNKLIFNKTA